MAKIGFPTRKLVLSFHVHIVKADVPIRFCLDFMDKLEVYYNNLDEEFIHRDKGENSQIMRQYGHRFLKWNALISCFPTTQ